jgi:hypothetical protein
MRRDLGIASVPPVSVKTDVDIIRALATRNGGEVVNPDSY